MLAARHQSAGATGSRSPAKPASACCSIPATVTAAGVRSAASSELVRAAVAVRGTWASAAFFTAVIRTNEG